MQNQIYEIMSRYVYDIEQLFEEKLVKIIVYGSCARGDNNENSDIDVMILLDVPEECLYSYRNMASDCAFNYLMSDRVDISPVVQSIKQYKYWADTLPFYQNIEREGVVLYA